MATIQRDQSYRLGLDLGARSLGWQVALLTNGEPSGIAACGVHTFDAGVDGDIEGGRDESRAAARRQARQTRRGFWRRQRRRLKVLRLLQSSGLLPAGDISTPEAVHQFFLQLDGQLAAKWCSPESTDGERVMLPYRLRAAALDRALEPQELGRALYHLAQRRGFKSNRKERPAETDENAKAKKKDLGIVESNIKSLKEEMNAANCKSIGQYFARLNPREHKVRRRHTDRAMFETEFDEIWIKQSTANSNLTHELGKSIRKALFDQRPLRNQSHLIGECELLPGKRRAPLGLRIAQKFRLLQKVNDLKIHRLGEPPRLLNASERTALLDALETRGDQSFFQVRKVLKLPADVHFNLQDSEEKKLLGNRTEAKLRKIFGKRWDALSDTERDRVVEDLLTYEKDTALQRRAIKQWKLDEDAAKELANTPLETRYLRHSPAALHKLVEIMGDGTSYATAKERFYGRTIEFSLDQLPPVRLIHRLTEPDVLEALKSGTTHKKIATALKTGIGNPAVERALTELRKVVNAIIGRYGKPDTIHVELARDLRNPRKQREEMAKRMRTRQKAREGIVEKIQKEAGIGNPSRADIEKGLLWDECAHHCPYTGKSIAFASLFGANPEFDIEHIIPLSRSLDDSFANKTLCYHEENRQVKRNKTPFEAYSGDAVRWREMLERVSRFNGPAADGKLRKFRMDESHFDEIYADFTQRQLNDTRYASKLASEYLGCLYGGQIDDQGRRRIQVSAGGVTAFLRAEWGLNGILGLKGEKNRDDHRHHAVDALCIALADPKTVQMLARAAEHPELDRRRRFAKIPPPWPGFLDDVRKKIEGIVVSRRVNHRVRGLLHADSLYSNEIKTGTGKSTRHIRKELHKLSSTEVSGDAIVDPVIRRLVKQKLEELGLPPAKAFAEPANHPQLPTRDGRLIPIHKVRVQARAKPWPVAQGARQRNVAAKAGTNHHSEIVASRNAKGQEIWEDYCVSLFEASERKRRGEPVIKKEWGPDRRLVFSLYPNDCVEMRDNDGTRRVYRVLSISDGDIEFRLHSVARSPEENPIERVRATSSKFWQSRDVRKVVVSHLGDVIPAND